MFMSAMCRMPARFFSTGLDRLACLSPIRVRTFALNSFLVWGILLALLPVSLPEAQAQVQALTTSINCPAQPITVSFSNSPVGTIAISNVKLGGPVISGGATNCGTVEPGSTFSLTLTYTIQDKTCGNCIHQIQVGYSNAPNPAACVFDGVVGPAAITATGTVTLTAPTTPGTYNLAFDRAQANSCKTSSWWSGAPGANQIIASITVGPDNDSWPNALPLNSASPATASAVYTYDQYLIKPNGSKWYKFQAGVNSKVIITLTGVSPNLNLPVNFDLSFHKDVRQSYDQLVQPQNSLQSTAEAAPEAFLPEAFLPEAFLPEAFLPEAFLPEAFLPEAFLPEAFLPEAFLPEAFLPEAFLPEAFLSTPQPYFGAVTRSLLSISAREGQSPELIARNTWNLSADKVTDQNGNPRPYEFYIRVKGRDGASSSAAPYHLQVTVINSACNSVTGVADSTPATLAPAGAAGQYKTVIVTDSGRLTGTDAEKAALTAKINTFAARPEVNGVLVDLGEKLSDGTPKYKRVAEANQIADAHQDCPFAKNVVAAQIKQIIDSYRPAPPATNLQYVVLLGPDSVVPFIRYPDEAGLANENTYWPPLRDSSSSQAALRNGLVLGQDGYGSSRSITRSDHAFPLPDLAVGRLVESASEINGMLTAYIATNGVITPRSALVTGYDFVSDVAQSEQGELQGALGATPDSLITPQGVPPSDPRSWTADQLRTKFLNTRHDMVFLAGHFSAYGAMAADYATRVASSEVEASTVDQTNVLLWSVGCHSGYNVPAGEAIPNLAEEPDWAQAFARKGMTSIIGTGFQYGDTDLVAFSEKLYLEFSRQLHTSANLVNGKSTVPVGLALLRAKQGYLSTTTPMRGIHEKVLLESALYGLPMLSVTLNGVTPPADNSVISGTTAVTSGDGQSLGLSTTDYTLNSSLTPHTTTLTNLNTNASLTAQYLSGTNGIVSNPLDPVFPLELRNVGLANTVLRGVGFRSGTYNDQSNVLPLTTAPADEIGRAHPAFGSSVFYPRQPWSVNYYDALNGGSTRLAVTPAQFVSNGPNSFTGTLRSYPQMNFRLYYSNNTGPATVALPPQVSNVAVTVSGGTASFSARVTGDTTAGVQEVWVTYTATSGLFYGKWQSVNLTRNGSDPALWQGSLPLGSTNPQDLRFLVQAANGTGLVTLSTNFGNYYSLANATPPTPTVQTSLSLQLSGSATAHYLDQPLLQAKLTGPSGPLAGQTVTFAMAGILRQVTTDSQGVATLNGPGATNPLTLRLLPGTYFLTASFAGTNTLIPSYAFTQFTVTKRPTVLSLSTPGTVQYSDPSGVVATLLDNVGKPVAQRTVFFVGTNTATNQQYGVAAFTDSTGKALLGAPQWPAGSYTLQAYFGGSNIPLFGTYTDSLYDNALPVTASGLLTITPEPVTITYTGDTFVPLGSTAHLAVQVGQPADGSPGNLTLGQVVFNLKDSNNTLIASSTQTLTPAGNASLDVANLGVGVYSVEVTVTGGYFTSPTSTFLVTVYDTTVSGGMVTGGGWFNSPAGAYRSNPSLTGRANFGFISKVSSGKTAPTGQTEFNLQLGNLKFHSTGYTSLSVNGAKAQYSGSGTVNGSGGYSFTVSVVDGQASGGGGTDKFGIKIWNTTTGQVIYDNTASPLGPTAIQGGNIVIKK